MLSSVSASWCLCMSSCKSDQNRKHTRDNGKKRTSDRAFVFECVDMYMHWFYDFSHKKAVKGDTEGNGEFSLQRLACSHPVCLLPQL